MTTPAGTIGISDIHTELSRSFTYYVTNFTVDLNNVYYGIQNYTEGASTIIFYMSSRQTFLSPSGPYPGFPFRFLDNEPVVFTSNGGACSWLTNGGTYYIRDINTIGGSSLTNGCYFTLSTTPGGAAIQGNAGYTITAGTVTFSRPLTSVSLNDSKIRYLADQGTGTVDMGTLRSKNRANINRNSAWSYTIARRSVGYSQINGGSSGGVLSSLPAYQTSDPYDFDSTDFYMQLDSTRFDSRASDQTLNMTVLLDFSYNTYYCDPSNSVFVGIPFTRPGNYSTNYPSNNVAIVDYANPAWDGVQMPFTSIFADSYSGSGTNQYRRGYLTATRPLALASNDNGWSYGSQNIRGWWNIGKLVSSTHMVSFSGRFQPLNFGDGVTHGWRIYGCYIGLNFSL